MENATPSSATTGGIWRAVSDPCMFGGEPFIAAEDGRGLVLAHVTHSGKGNYEGQLGDPLADARMMTSGPDLRKASQELYDRLQEYLDVSDAQLIEQGHEALVEAMDTMEAAWHKADGTVPEQEHGKSA